MTEQPENNHLEERIARLERKVRELEQALREHPGEVEGSSRAKAGAKPGPEGEPNVRFEETTGTESAAESRWIPDENTLSENWLNWLGIGLLLLGVVFLFKYSIDQGWLIPPVRSGFGLAIGIGLLGSGFVIDRKNLLHQILLGGGIAAFYITGFATFQLYEFLSHEVVWVFMFAVTLLALVLSLRQDEALLSVLGILGGLGTPFMLYSGDGSLLMLVLYTALILTGSAAIYMVKGWKSLLWASAFGGWLVLVVGWYNNVADPVNPTSGDRWSLQLGAIYAGIVLWILPVFRELLTKRDPAKWPNPSPTGTSENSTAPFMADANVQVMSVIIPVLTLFYSYGIWSMEAEFWGFVALVAALIVGFSYLPLRMEGLQRLSMVHGFTALILITVALFLLLEGEILLIALALEGLCLRIISDKTGERNISYSSNILFGFVGLWLMTRFMNTPVAEIPIANLDAITELFILGIAGLVIPAYLEKVSKNMASLYRLLAHLGFLGWFMKELAILQDGQAYVTVAWGLYALTILFIGFWQSSRRIRFLGMATIFLVVGKLFLIDLTQINTLLRIILFIGFGAVFLAVSYFLQKKWGSIFSKE